MPARWAAATARASVSTSRAASPGGSGPAASRFPPNKEARESVRVSDRAPDPPLVREVVREMTVKAGQKCTAIRRIFVPADKADAIADAIAAKLKGTKVGDPRREDTRMGPLVTRGQQAAAFEGIRALAAEASVVCGGADAPELLLSAWMSKAGSAKIDKDTLPYSCSFRNILLRFASASVL